MGGESWGGLQAKHWVVVGSCVFGPLFDSLLA
jgi:hypothetical protein